MKIISGCSYIQYDPMNICNPGREWDLTQGDKTLIA
jgi:hypothetical protein